MELYEFKKKLEDRKEPHDLTNQDQSLFLC